MCERRALDGEQCLTSVDAARAYLSPSAGMTNIDDRLTTRLAYLNFINNVDNARSDLPNPEPLPFSPVASAQKPSDGQNVAMRLRGYMNIAKAGIYTFGVQADDGFSLLIGGTPISQSTTNDVVCTTADRCSSRRRACTVSS